MVRTLQLTLSLLFVFYASSSMFAQKFGFNEILENQPDRITTFCVPVNSQNKKTLLNNSVLIKYEVSGYYFISTTPQWIKKALDENEISDFYFEFAPPVTLSDTARATHFVDEVHAGTGGLESSYTGKGIIYGFVDTGIELLHPDFQDSAGKTRVVRYWDQSMPDNGSSPAPYGYGYEWDSTEINAGLCTSGGDNNSGHGTQVAGQGSGNGFGNGSNKGMAPDANIVIVETDFSRPNWTLTVADAVDYIFKIADIYDMPAVVNLSLGTYFGSHDGNDPASVAIEALLDEKPGRIVVSAAGNSGFKGEFHQQGNVTTDTNFVWFLNNPSGGFGANTIFFDLWSDGADATYNFSFGANETSTNWLDRGETNTWGAMENFGPPLYDTIWNGPNRIATFEVYRSFENGNYHMQVLGRIDSTSYRYRFETSGSGKYDLWSGQWLGYNDMIVTPPPASEFPDSIYYVAPDLNQSLVSSWNCSEKVVTVGNFRNRWSFVDKNGNNYSNSDPTVAGQLSHNSSKGPNRHGVIKPDVIAAGDVSLAAAPFVYLNNPAYNAAIDSGGLHIGAGGTSMSSPVVGGIAALYLERCNKATYQDFLTDIKATAFEDGFTGTIPNNADGYGKIHALNTLLEETIPTTPIVTLNWAAENLSSSETTGNQWFLNDTLLTGETNEIHIPSAPFGSYQVLYTNMDGCSAISDPLIVTVGLNPKFKNGFSASPNPTNNIISIEYSFNIESVRVFDLTGKEHFIDKISDDSYSLKSLSSGNYILEIISQEGKFTSKIIKL